MARSGGAAAQGAVRSAGVNPDDEGTITQLTPAERERAALDLSEGDRLDRYVLRGTLGEGGMGTVFRAEQLHPIRRQVAVKVIQLGMNTAAMLSRFEAERQILAVLDHPNVASILDAGATPGGRPYFVLELVDGVRIDRYADAARLDIRERVALFIQVLAGVEHAHQKGIIHRDLKPSNILVADKDGAPVAKIIDFGIAKSLASLDDGDGPLTRAGEFVGTPRYMSPEQARLQSRELDVRTDVFSLGVLLYELLVGLPPFVEQVSEESEATRELSRRSAEHPSKRLKSVDEELEAIVRARRLSPQALGRVFSGDLSNILLKATETERERRYRNVAEFADDLHRYLDGYPVLARPRSTLYTLSKFAQRHKAWIAVGACALILVAGLAAFATIEFFRAERHAAAASLAAAQARDLQAEAEREARTARRVTEFLVRVFETAAPGQAADADITVREVLHRSLPTIEAALEDDPPVRARLLLAVADVLASLGEFEAARPLFEEAVALGRVLEDSELLVDALLAQGHAEKDAFATKQAEALVREALSLAEGQDAPATALARALQSLASVLLAQGRNEEAVPLFGEAVGLWEKLAPDSEGHLFALQGLATAWNDHRLGRRTGLIYLREVAAMVARRYGEDHHETAGVLRNLAGAEALLGPLDAALDHNSQALAIFLETVGEDHAETRLTRNWRGRILLSFGAFEAVDRVADEVLASFESDGETPIGDPDYHWALHNQALAALARGEHEQVLRRLDELDVSKLGGLQRREAAMARAFALRTRGDRGAAIEALRAIEGDFTGLHRAELLWAEAMIRPTERERLCQEGVAVLEEPRAALGESSELVVYAQHERLRRCVGERAEAMELARFLDEQGYVDLFTLAAARLPP